MRVLLINQFFWPDAAPTSQLLTDVSRALAKQGHDVAVLCSQGLYAASESTEQPPPVTVHRIPGSQFGSGKLSRAASYITFLAGALWKGATIERADVVITLTTPPMLPFLGTLLRKLRHRRHFIWEMDLFPDALVDAGMLPPTSFVLRVLGAIADYSRKRSDGVIALGECMRQRLLARGIPSHKIHVAENWSDGTLIYPLLRGDDGQLTILYSGNLGLLHDTETILSCINKLRHNKRFRFLFAGGGARRKGLKDACARNGLENVSFLPYGSRDDMAVNLAQGDLGLVTQLDSCCGTVVPSKVYGIMAAGRPLLFIGPRDATPSRIIQRFQCGWQIDCGDTQGLLDLLNELALNPTMHRVAGSRARQAFLAHYDLHRGVARICGIIGADILPRRKADSHSDSNRFSVLGKAPS